MTRGPLVLLLAASLLVSCTDSSAQNQVTLARANAEDALALGMVAIQQHDYPLAVTRLTEALAGGLLSADDQVAAHVDRGVAYKSMRKCDLAIADFGTALTLESDSIAYADRGGCEAQGQHPDLAKADFDAAIKADPGSAIAYGARADFELGQGDSARAVADYSKALEIAPYVVDDLVGRGEAYRVAHRRSEALADFDAALARDPTLDKVSEERKQLLAQ